MEAWVYKKLIIMLSSCHLAWIGKLLTLSDWLSNIFYSAQLASTVSITVSAIEKRLFDETSQIERRLKSVIMLQMNKKQDFKICYFVLFSFGQNIKNTSENQVHQ